MDDDHREIVRRLFTLATELIETAHETAMAGQSGSNTVESYAEAAHRLGATAREVAVIAEAAMILANMGVNQDRNRPERPL